MSIEVNHDRIREAIGTIKRREGGLTNNDVAKLIGFETGATLASRLKCKYDWKLSEVVNIANLYGCDLNEFTKEVEE